MGKSYARYLASLDSETVIVPDEGNKVINSENIYIVGDRAIMVLQGHYHLGAEHTIDGIPYITIPAMCEGKDNSYRILTLR